MPELSAPSPTLAPLKDPFKRAAFAAVLSAGDVGGRRVLDLGCGDGDLLAHLAARGAEVRGTTYLDRDHDYIRHRDHHEGGIDVPVDGGINLNEPLPYDDASFDVVVSTEVIEHIEGHRNFVSEAGRVLRDGGVLVLTTPNLNRLVSRLYFAFTGIHILKRQLPGGGVPLSRMEEYHHRVPEVPHLHWLLWQSGLRIESCHATRVWPISRALRMLRPLAALGARRGVRRYPPESEADVEQRADLARWLAEPVMLTSEQLCLTCRRRPRPGG